MGSLTEGAGSILILVLALALNLELVRRAWLEVLLQHGAGTGTVAGLKRPEIAVQGWPELLRSHQPPC